MSFLRFICPVLCVGMLACSGADTDVAPEPDQPSEPAVQASAPKSVDVEGLDLTLVDDALIVLVDGAKIEALIDVNLLGESDDCLSADRLEQFFTDSYGAWLSETSRDGATVLDATLVRVLSYDEYDKVEDVDIIGNLSVDENGVKRALEIECQ